MGKNLKQIFFNGKSHEGGVLLTVLSLLLVFSLMFSFRVSNSQFENQMRYNLQEYYEGKSLRNLAVAVILVEHQRPIKEDTVTGVLKYNLGQVNYIYSSSKITMTVKLKTGKIMNEIEMLDK